MEYQQAAIAWLFLMQVSADDAHRGIAAAGVEVQASDVVWMGFLYSTWYAWYGGEIA